MVWQTIIIILAILVLAILIFTKKYQGGKNLFKWSPIKNKVIQIATPKRGEAVLISLMIVFGLWFDITKNQVLAYGENHMVTWFGNIQSNAFILAQIMLILFFITLITLFVMSIKSKDTNITYDFIFGVLAIFGASILMTAFFYELYRNTITVLGITMNSISFHHIGIVLCGIYAMYLTFTK